MDARDLLKEARTRRERGQFDEALGKLEDAIAALTDEAPAELRGEILHERGFVLSVGLRLRTRGESDLREAATLLPHSARPLVDLGILAMERDPEEAANYYQEALRREPEHEVALHNLAIVLADQGRIDEAEQLAKKLVACATDPFQRGAAWSFLANLALGKGDLESAEGALRLALQESKHSRDRCMLATVSLARGAEVSDARREFEAGIEAVRNEFAPSFSETVEVDMRIAWFRSLVSRGERTLALEQRRRILEMSPSAVGLLEEP